MNENVGLSDTVDAEVIPGGKVAFKFTDEIGFAFEFIGDNSAFSQQLYAELIAAGSLKQKAQTACDQYGIPNLFENDTKYLSTWVNEINATPSGEAQNSAVRKVENELRSLLQSREVLLPSSPLGSRISQLPTSGPVAFARWSVTHPGAGGLNLKRASGGDMPATDIIHGALAVSPLRPLSIGIDDASMTARMKILNDRLAWLDEEVRKFSDRHKALGAFEELTKTKMATQAAVTHWKKAADVQSGRGGLATFMMIVGIIAVAVATFVWVKFAIPNFGRLSEWTLAVVAALPMAFGAWLLRFPARVFVQSRALEADATHRAAMVETFLALGQDTKSPPTPRERELILQALFRPGPGDAPDVPAHESFTNAIAEVVNRKP